MVKGARFFEAAFFFGLSSPAETKASRFGGARRAVSNAQWVTPLVQGTGVTCASRGCPGQWAAEG